MVIITISELKHCSIMKTNKQSESSMHVVNLLLILVTDNSVLLNMEINFNLGQQSLAEYLYA